MRNKVFNNLSSISVLTPKKNSMTTQCVVHTHKLAKRRSIGKSLISAFLYPAVPTPLCYPTHHLPNVSLSSQKISFFGSLCFFYFLTFTIPAKAELYIIICKQEKAIVWGKNLQNCLNRWRSEHQLEEIFCRYVCLMNAIGMERVCKCGKATGKRGTACLPVGCEAEANRLRRRGV